MNHRANLLVSFKTLPRVFSLLYKNDRKYLFIMLLEVVAFSIDKYPSLLIMKYTIDALTRNMVYKDYMMTIIPLVLIMLTLKIIRAVINTSRPYRDQVITERLFNAFFVQCMKIDYQTLESKEVQDKIELAKYITNGKIAAIGWYFVEMFSSLISLIIATIIMVRINIVVWVVVLIGSSFKVILAKEHSDKSVSIKKKQVVENRYLSYLYSIGTDYEYVKEFRVFNYKKNLNKRILDAKCKFIESNNKLLNNNFLFSLVNNIENIIIKMLSFVIMGFSYLKSIVTISDFTYMIELVNDYILYSSSFISSCKSYVEAIAYIEHYEEFMSFNGSQSLSGENCRHLDEHSHTIEFKNVYFKYPNTKDYVLKNINLKFCVPMKISIVGRNGAGKSTLIKLLLKLYKPDKGQIMIDGVDIFEYTNEEYLSIFSSVFQDFVLFAFSVSDNITSFDANNNHDLFRKIVTETGVCDFIWKYPRLYDTYVSNAYSNDGVEFSGGEQQKIALARAIYKDDARFYILDEPTSTYDADAEYQLYKKYESILFDKASIFISHRLSSCKLSDHIILLENGEVIEQGSHDELMNADTRYKHMFQLQANQYHWDGDRNEQ